MPSAKGRKGKGEKKIGITQDLSKTEVRQDASNVTISAGVLPTNMNQEHLNKVLKDFSLVITFLNLSSKCYMLCRNFQMSMKKNPFEQEM